jgi:hypothetical protein
MTYCLIEEAHGNFTFTLHSCILCFTYLLLDEGSSTQAIRFPLRTRMNSITIDHKGFSSATEFSSVQVRLKFIVVQGIVVQIADLKSTDDHPLPAPSSLLLTVLEGGLLVHELIIFLITMAEFSGKVNR